MKNILLLLLTFIILTLSCRAQSPVVNIDATPSETPDGAYYKDINNDLGRFVGTWEFNTGNRSFRIVLRKVVQYFDGDNYEDLLIGEYRYVENGTEIINTIPSLNNNIIDAYDRNIVGNIITRNNAKPVCLDCNESERRIELVIADPLRAYLTTHVIVLRYINFNQITATIATTHGIILPHEGSPKELRVPNGEYTMVKE
ncbi:DUF6705 family protein [Winogradskyella immobilis]|uniref:DUF6705 domain-containing protein n=1 Tax=Winogradskyella immobilis TaxID=2816852 RepID=A0ABS8EMG8_9FLAO|nr:DUF6705 family protein [Winogradskyella immobilis]MCC1484413.1 hypothetical protein [Winogradskyella immobilis]MCG0016505.1 hypothetical protein [Winogradskyella immobilis]